MSKGSVFRAVSLLMTTTAASVGAFLGLPVKWAAAQVTNVTPGRVVTQPAARMVVIQPRYVSPTATSLLNIVEQALSDNALAQRIFRDPDAVAAQYRLSSNERLVLRHITPQQFQVARADAAQLVATRTANARLMRLPPGATDGRLITERMIVGRAILAAAGRSYLDAADAHGCCPWSKAIELGINSDPAYYNEVFQAGAGGGPH